MLTPSERRGALIVLALLALGSAWDAWQAMHPELRELASPGTEVNAAGSAFAPAATTPSSAAGVSADSSGAGAARWRDRNAAAGGGHAAPHRRGKAPPARPIDLNRAGADEFHALPGIGPVLAARMVEYRRAHGRFGSVEELLAVRGIGPHLFERIRPYVRI